MRNVKQIGRESWEYKGFLIHAIYSVSLNGGGNDAFMVQERFTDARGKEKLRTVVRSVRSVNDACLAIDEIVSTKE